MKVVFSQRAMTMIMLETLEKISTETGGVFLGYRDEDIWYVLESSDPGPKSIFEITYFEYDQNYINHVINKISRLYKLQLEIIGLWHRHPDSMDTFSRTDDQTNSQYAELNKLGAISMLVNIDPTFRITPYLVKNPLSYEKIQYFIGDQNIPDKYKKFKSLTVLKKQIEKTNKVGKKSKKSFPLVNSKISFSVKVHEFLRKKTFNGAIKTCKENYTENIEEVLNRMNGDIDFLNRNGVNLSFKLENKKILKVTFDELNKDDFNMIFVCVGNDICFKYNEIYYKYHPGLMEEMYVR